jgi:ribosomal protein S18 acetylase RimI-like enzyme
VIAVQLAPRGRPKHPSLVVKTEVVRSVTPEIVEAFRVLLRELSPGSPELTVGELEDIVSFPANTVLVARDEHSGRVIGTATVVSIRIPSGRRARLESVVVHPSARGRGVGEALCRHAIAVARQSGAAFLDLTSAPTRSAANRLYGRLGFTRRTTNVYRLDLRGDDLP